MILNRFTENQVPLTSIGLAPHCLFRIAALVLWYCKALSFTGWRQRNGGKKAKSLWGGGGTTMSG